jgi:hypothetical protein
MTEMQGSLSTCMVPCLAAQQSAAFGERRSPSHMHAAFLERERERESENSACVR